MGDSTARLHSLPGAARGRGRAAAVLFSREGAKVVVADISREGGERTTALARDLGGDVTFIHTDVTESTSVQQAIAETVRTYGKLNVLYNNAGGSTAQDGTVTEVSIEEFWRAIKLDLFGTFLCSKYGIPEIIKAGGGAIVNMTSVVALAGMRGGRDAYTSAKGGSFVDAVDGGQLRETQNPRQRDRSPARSWSDRAKEISGWTTRRSQPRPVSICWVWANRKTSPIRRYFLPQTKRV